jgi:hypothetical protein
MTFPLMRLPLELLDSVLADPGLCARDHVRCG